jgi:hypothetical protein
MLRTLLLLKLMRIQFIKISILSFQQDWACPLKEKAIQKHIFERFFGI